MKRAAFLLGGALALLGALAPGAAALRITDVTLIDGTGAPPRPGVSILVRGGRIAAISRAPPEGAERVIAGHGGYALPGLMDGHTHLASVPGGAFRGDSAALRACLLRHHLHAFLAAGVTSVLDNAASTGLIQTLHHYFAAGGAGPRVYYLAPFLTPPQGYFATPDMRRAAHGDLWPPVATRADVIAQLEQARALHPVGVKVVIEQGFGPFAVWKVHGPAMRRAIREEAERRGMPLFIHSMSNAAHRLALQMAPRALVHGLFDDETPAPDVVQAIKAAQVSVVSTIGVYHFPQLQWRPAGLADPLLRLVVPPREIATARDPAAWKFQNDALFEANTPAWMPASLGRAVGGWFYSREILAEKLAAAQRNLKTLYDAGIPLVVGSDSGNWPVFLSLFHGVGTIREMVLLAEAGLPPMAILRAATQQAARLMGAQGELGTLAPGQHADLLILKSNPLEDIHALEHIEWVIKGGQARRPAQWMALAPRCP